MVRVMEVRAAINGSSVANGSVPGHLAMMQGATRRRRGVANERGAAKGAVEETEPEEARLGNWADAS